MARLTERELTTQRRVETVIRIVAPALDLLLAAGDRVSRLSGPDLGADEWAPRPLSAEDSRRVTSIGR